MRISRLLSVLFLGLLFCCTPESANKNGGDNTNPSNGDVTPVPATSLTLDRKELRLIVGQKETLIATVEPTGCTEEVVWGCEDDKIVSVDKGEVQGLAPGVTKVYVTVGQLSETCDVTVSGVAPSGAVDMGLSVYWASCNLGAYVPQQFGDYYAWGETQPKKVFTWDNYAWCKDGSYTNLQRYNNNENWGIVDNKAHLDMDDDAAQAKLHGTWHIPSKENWQELCDECEWEWTSSYNESGVEGYIVKAKNGNSLFLPGAGYKYPGGESNRNPLNYWTSDLAQPTYYAFALDRWLGDDEQVTWFITPSRCFGLPIRAVAY